ncbi:hypothetical protein OE88DRAFT_1667898 [Heliocybe sulcata]|uniref:Uncharacterized protein n=1 Tax=Heliocybe sulcata TaxID=5364 RepID=A0A5C3MLU5_9AGAM|nr:hypothetical protein OE88DRAFT_1667898 [Heliocybe sulcata]
MPVHSESYAPDLSTIFCNTVTDSIILIICQKDRDCLDMILTIIRERLSLGADSDSRDRLHLCRQELSVLSGVRTLARRGDTRLWRVSEPGEQHSAVTECGEAFDKATQYDELRGDWSSIRWVPSTVIISGHHHYSRPITAGLNDRGHKLCIACFTEKIPGAYHIYDEGFGPTKDTILLIPDPELREVTNKCRAGGVTLWIMAWSSLPGENKVPQIYWSHSKLINAVTLEETTDDGYIYVSNWWNGGPQLSWNESKWETSNPPYDDEILFTHDSTISQDELDAGIADYHRRKREHSTMCPVRERLMSEPWYRKLVIDDEALHCQLRIGKPPLHWTGKSWKGTVHCDSETLPSWS